MNEDTQVIESQVTDVAETTEALKPEKTYTESEISAMVAARLAKQEKALTAKLQAELEEQNKRANMDEVERLKAEKADYEAQLTQARQEAKAAKLQAELTGKVANPKAALAVATAEGLVSDEGIDIEAFLIAHPYFAMQQKTQTTAVASANSGMAKGGYTRDQIRAMSSDEIKRLDPAMLAAAYNS